MRKMMAMSIVLAALSACGGGGNDSAGRGELRLPVVDNIVSVAKSAGAIQCQGAGLSLAALQGQLTEAKVAVREAACGADGVVYPAVCGAPGGRIGVFQIAAADLPAAEAAGFKPLSTMPDATIVPCS